VDGLTVPVADHGKSGLDDIDLQSGELTGNLQLLAQIHGGAGALLAIAQGRVKDEDSVVVHKKGSGTTGSVAAPGKLEGKKKQAASAECAAFT
jgi:hypothetical protein